MLIRHLKNNFALMIFTSVFLLLPSLLLGQENTDGKTNEDDLFDLEDFDLFDSETKETTDNPDDFLFDEETPESTDSTSATDDEWGFDDEETTDADSTENDEVDEWDILGDGSKAKDEMFLQEKTITVKKDEPEKTKSNHPLNFSKYTDGTFLENMAFVFSINSPFSVSQSLKNWNSFIDWRLRIQSPFLLKLGPIGTAFGLDLGSYNFEFFIPSSQLLFSGYSATLYTELYMPKMPYGRVDLGLGALGSAFGMTWGLGAEYNFESLVFSSGLTGYHVFTSKEPGSSTWWDYNTTIGVRF